MIGQASCTEGLGAHQKLPTSARIELTTSKTHIATWHGAERSVSSSAPHARKSLSSLWGAFSSARRGRVPQALHSTQMSRNPGLNGGQLLVSRGGSYVESRIMLSSGGGPL